MGRGKTIVEFFSAAISVSVPRNRSWRAWGFLEMMSAAWNSPSAWMTLARRSRSASALLLIILLYIAFFASAMGPLVWVVMAEIFPIKVRGSAMGLATLILWLADFAVTLTFPVISDKFHPSTAFWL
jgi:MFS family permease